MYKLNAKVVVEDVLGWVFVKSQVSTSWLSVSLCRLLVRDWGFFLGHMAQWRLIITDFHRPVASIHFFFLNSNREEKLT